MNNLALFPLGVVLFPESTLPLHIFEDRYKELVNTCLEEKRQFGINLINPKNMHDVGCSAEVFRVLKKYPDGKMDVLVKGIKRYKLISFAEGEFSYYMGEVDFFEDEDNTFDRELLLQCTDLFNQVANRITTVKVDEIDPERVGTNKPSFLIAQKSGLSLKQRQSLLEIRSEDERLQALIDHLNTLLPVIKETELVTQLIKNDGYFPPKI